MSKLSKLEQIPIPFPYLNLAGDNLYRQVKNTRHAAGRDTIQWPTVLRTEVGNGLTHFFFVSVFINEHGSNAYTRFDPKVFRRVVLKEYCALRLAADTVTT
jgi:hypothetical protein